MEVCDEKVRSLNKLSELWDTFFLDTKIQGILDAIEVFASKPEVSILLELHTDSESLLLVKFLENGENVLYLSDPWFDQFAHAPDEEE